MIDDGHPEIDRDVRSGFELMHAVNGQIFKEATIDQHIAILGVSRWQQGRNCTRGAHSLPQWTQAMTVDFIAGEIRRNGKIGNRQIRNVDAGEMFAEGVIKDGRINSVYCSRRPSPGKVSGTRRYIPTRNSSR